MQRDALILPGCFVLRPGIFADARGWFLKTAHAPAFEAMGLRTDWREDFVSASGMGVLRGMHFQTPPADHAKLVACLRGAVLDVLVDLRRGSPTFGRHVALELRGGTGELVYMPAGIAHGFLSLEDDSLMYYKVTHEHAPARDGGIAWDSFGFDWPMDAPVVSDRDRGHPALAAFDTPFAFNGTGA